LDLFTNGYEYNSLSKEFFTVGDQANHIIDTKLIDPDSKSAYDLPLF